MSSYLFLVCGDNIVVRNRFSLEIFFVPEQHDHNDMGVTFRQVTILPAVPIFLLITRILFSPALSYGFYEMMLIVSHHRVIDRISDMFPSFLRQIYLIAITVCNGPADCRHICQTIHMIIDDHQRMRKYSQGNDTLTGRRSASEAVSVSDGLCCFSCLSELSYAASDSASSDSSGVNVKISRILLWISSLSSFSK